MFPSKLDFYELELVTSIDPFFIYISSLTPSLDLYFMEMILGVLLFFDSALNPKSIQLLRWKVIKDQSAVCIGIVQRKNFTLHQAKKIESSRGILGANRVILSN